MKTTCGNINIWVSNSDIKEKVVSPISSMETSMKKVSVFGLANCITVNINLSFDTAVTFSNEMADV